MKRKNLQAIGALASQKSSLSDETLQAALDGPKSETLTAPTENPVEDAVMTAQLSDDELKGMLPPPTDESPKVRAEVANIKQVDSLLDPGLQGPTASEMALKTDQALDTASGESDLFGASPSLSAATRSMQGVEDQPVYPEESKIKSAIDGTSIPQAKLSQLGTMTAAERAKVGAMVGGGLGIQQGGHFGGMMGAAIGAQAARAAGFVQSGELEDAKRNSKVAETMLDMKVLNKKGVLAFEDGVEFQLNPDPAYRLQNVSSATGKPNRSIYEMDSTHPFTRRSTAVARPLAYYMTHGLLKYSKLDDARDLKALDNTTGLMVNAMQKDAGSVDQVYERARYLAKKFGVTEKGMRSYFDSIKKDVPDQDAIAIKQGLELLYPADNSKRAS